MACGAASLVSSNSICISMTCVMPARDTAAMFSAVQIPPPTAIRPVTHLMSILKAPCSKGWYATDNPGCLVVWGLNVADKRSAARTQRLVAVAQLSDFILSYPQQAQ